MKTLFRNAIVAAAGLAGLSGAVHADPIFLGPTPYLSAAASPFNPAGFGYFHLENFEDHLLNTPGVSANTGGVTSVVFGPSSHDSVDADDGLIDGSGSLGDSFFTSVGATGVRFTFSAAALGSLPTSAGLVWTDGGGTSVTFSAFGPGDVLLFTQTVSGFADGSNGGTTAEDRFLGVVDAAGISAIFISNPGGGLEVDHLQYGGGVSVAAVPEPETYALMLAGLASLGWVARRRKQRR
jgi:hypothetical protein